MTCAKLPLRAGPGGHAWGFIRVRAVVARARDARAARGGAALDLGSPTTARLRAAAAAKKPRVVAAEAAHNKANKKTHQ